MVLYHATLINELLLDRYREIGCRRSQKSFSLILKLGDVWPLKLINLATAFESTTKEVAVKNV